jgi:hypothetical protein
LPIAVLFWIVICVSTIAGLLSLTLYGVKSVQRHWGIISGFLSTVAGVGGTAFFVIFTERIGLLGWAGVLIPRIVGVVDLVLWKNRKNT